MSLEYCKENSSHNVLLVDLDGTLIRSDSLFELLFSALKANPLLLFLFPIYLFCSISYAKSLLAHKYLKTLPRQPFSDNVLDYVKKRKEKGDKIYLLTAANIVLARRIVKDLNLFDAIYASTKRVNLKGKNKAAFIVKKFGKNVADYIGNDNSDIDVWKISRKVVVANANSSLVAKSKILFKDKLKIIEDIKINPIKSFLKLIRVHQWVKNILIFLPLLLSHTYYNLDKLVLSLIAFFAFSLSASATYIFNDILDLDNDRVHSKKKFRPIASGYISITKAVSIMCAIWVLSVFLVLNISLSALAMLLAYSFIVLVYSYKIKKIIVVDIMILAFLYMYRIYFGGVATSIEISFWLASCSVFFFLSLASIKRYVEILKLDNVLYVKGRDYCVRDNFVLANIGISSGIASIITYLLYISKQAYSFYENPSILMLESFIILYFIIKIWIMAGRGLVYDDPVVYAIKTKENYVLGILSIVILFFAKPI